jgi:hypothetical protein
MTTRCKFRLDSMTHHANYTGKTLVFSAVSEATKTIPEDQAFTKYTPTGKLEVTIDNPAVSPMLKVGGFYYLDLTLIEE